MNVYTSDIVVHRYATVARSTAISSAFDSLLTQVGFLTAREYAAELLQKVHGAPKTGVGERANTIAAHADAALAFIDQARSASTQVAFLPGYYAILNFLKLYILLSPRHAELASNRWHGVQYKVDAKDSRTIGTEVVHTKTGGALPLFYRVITGRQLAPQAMRMADIYPYIADIGAEWEIATGKPPQLAAIRFEATGTSNSWQLDGFIAHPTGKAAPELKQLPALKRLLVDPSDKLRLLAPKPFSKAMTPAEIAATCVDRSLAYYPHLGTTTIPIGRKRTKLFEELPIALAFFHLSSVVRYKPDFVAKVLDSRYGPVLSAMRADALHRFVLLFWSYAQQSTIYIRQP